MLVLAAPPISLVLHHLHICDIHPVEVEVPVRFGGLKGCQRRCPVRDPCLHHVLADERLTVLPHDLSWINALMQLPLPLLIGDVRKGVVQAQPLHQEVPCKGWENCQQ